MSENENCGKSTRKTTIGGQALIEGLMMIGPVDAAIAIRKPDGEIIVEKRPLAAKNKFSKVYVLRGVLAFVRQLIVGIKALMFSAEYVDMDEDDDNDSDSAYKKSWFDRFLEKLLGDASKEVIIYTSLIFALAFIVGVFILLPNFLAGLLQFDKKTNTGVLLYNLFEGLVRIIIFFTYLSLISKMKDIQRVWQYHGAEHKTIHCYEQREELTVENIRKYPTSHPRCGTSFLFIVVIISILIFSFAGWYSPIVNILIRIALTPLVAGISYEILKIAGRHADGFFSFVNIPGMYLQKFTTREPDDSQIEVAIAAFNGVEIPNKGDDNW